MHGIVWTDECLHKVERIWKYGWIWKGKGEVKYINGRYRGQLTNYVNESTVSYITKYVTKADEKHKLYKPIILTSAGIGKDYVKSLGFSNNKHTVS